MRETGRAGIKSDFKRLETLIGLIIAVLVLHSCVLYTAYGLYRTVQDINLVLDTVSTAMTKIRTVLEEGQNLKQAADDGRLISTLAKKIPALIQEEVEQTTREKIQTLSGELNTSAVDLTAHALEENLIGARNAYNNMVDVYNRFSDLMEDLYNRTVP